MRPYPLFALSIMVSGAVAASPESPESLRAQDSPDVLQQVVVRASFREQNLQQTPSSVTVLDAATLRGAGQQHLEDVLALVPNLNWAGGTSRPRYFQIRGIGEREQYEGAPNASVGFLIDDIDFSGIGMPATLFDISQVEVLRGPQGTRYGANALAGLIAVRSADPSSELGMSVEASAAEYGTGALGFVATGPAQSLDSAWRLAVQKYRSDGFRRDAFLGRDDTNDRDELTARLKWRWQPSSDTRVDFTLLHSNLDNGYDAWSIDNSWRSQADRPGVDTQRATAGAIRLESDAFSAGTLTVIGTHGDSKSVNSYDGDWGNAELWAPYTYDYFARSDRDRRTSTLEVRFATPAPKAPGSIAWLVGAYGLRMNEDGRDTSQGVYEDPFDPGNNGLTDDAIESAYRATNASVFGQLDGRLSERWRWSMGVRAEQRSARYRDGGIWNGEPRASDLDSRDRMLGGQLSLSFDVSDTSSWYASLSRGYKAGGFNLGRVPPERLEFKPEYLWNVEIGAKQSWLGGRLYADTALFYSRRRDVQVRTGDQLDQNDPNSFVFFTDNASAGYNYGLESSVRWLVGEQWDLGASVGLLRTRYLDYAQGETLLPDREQAHAPEYQVSLSGGWHHPAGWMARVDVSAVDAFYFDVPPNNSRSSAYSVTNLKAGYETDRWAAYLWGRNVFDETYAVRGFFFGNEPPDFPDKLYIQRGDPRQFGVTFTYSFR